MPIPRGINDPAVRGPWLAERQEKLAEFDRLTGKGHPAHKAARAVGLSLASVRSMQRSVSDWQEGRQHGGPSGANIDLELALLSCLRRPGERLTFEDIAAWCDCRPQSIQHIERRALRKLRLRLMERGEDADLVEQVLDFPAKPRLRHAA